MLCPCSLAHVDWKDLPENLIDATMISDAQMPKMAEIDIVDPNSHNTQARNAHDHQRLDNVRVAMHTHDPY